MNQQLPLDFQNQSVKKLALERLRLPITVMVDVDSATVTEVRSWNIRAFSAYAQYVVPNPNWLVRIRMAVENLDRMKTQHRRETDAMIAVIQEIMCESRQLTDSELAGVQAQGEMPQPQPFPDPDDPDEGFNYPVPF